MSVYFQALTTSGEVQVSDSTQYWHLTSAKTLGNYYKHTSARNFSDEIAGSGSHTGYFYQIASGEVKKLFLIHNPSSEGVNIWSQYMAPHYYSQNPYAAHWDTQELGQWVLVHDCDKELADNLIVYEYSADVDDDTNVGLVCYNADGKCVFSSASYPLQIADFFNFIHTTSAEVGWTSDWKLVSQENTYSFPIGVWLMQSGGGGSGGGALGSAKHIHLYISKNYVRTAWATSFENEHRKIFNTYYWDPMQLRLTPTTQYIVGNLSNLKSVVAE